MKQKKARSKNSPGLTVPVLRIHNSRGVGRFYARFHGRPIWFGRVDDPTSQARFDEYLAQWLARGRRPEATPEQGLPISGVVAQYLRHLGDKHDEGWHENNNPRIGYALRPLLTMFGSELAEEFSPLKLEAVQRAMISGGRRCVGTINARVQIIRRCFEWAASQELIPASVIVGLKTVQHLRAGEFGVSAGRVRKEVDEETLVATLPYLHPVLRDIVELLRWSAARPAEIFNLTPEQIDRSRPGAWPARLKKHKNAKKGKVRMVPFGPRAQAILRRHMDRVPKPAEDKPIFSPDRAMEEHNHHRRKTRKTELWDSHVTRQKREKAQRKRPNYADRYDARVVTKAIGRAVARANQERRRRNAEEDLDLPMLERWTIYRVRHTGLGRVRASKYGLEGAKAVGGHSSVSMTEDYTIAAEHELALKIAAEMG